MIDNLNKTQNSLNDYDTTNLSPAIVSKTGQLNNRTINVMDSNSVKNAVLNVSKNNFSKNPSNSVSSSLTEKNSVSSIQDSLKSNSTLQEIIVDRNDPAYRDAKQTALTGFKTMEEASKKNVVLVKNEQGGYTAKNITEVFTTEKEFLEFSKKYPELIAPIGSDGQVIVKNSLANARIMKEDENGNLVNIKVKVLSAELTTEINLIFSKSLTIFEKNLNSGIKEEEKPSSDHQLIAKQLQMQPDLTQKLGTNSNESKLNSSHSPKTSFIDVKKALIAISISLHTLEKRKEEKVKQQEKKQEHIEQKRLDHENIREETKANAIKKDHTKQKVVIPKQFKIE